MNTSLSDTSSPDQGDGLLFQADAFRHFFENAPVGIFFFDPYDSEAVMRVVSCNAMACSMHGLTKHDVLGHSIRRIDPNFFIWDNHDYFNGSEFVAMLANSEVHEGIAEHRRSNGDLLIVEYRTLLLEVGDHLYVVGIELDVTEREQQRIELQQTRQQLLDAIESMREGVMIFNAKDELVAFNEESIRLLNVVADCFRVGITHQEIMEAYATRITPEARGMRSVEEYIEASLKLRANFAKNMPVRFIPGRHHRLSHWPMAAGGIVSVVTDVTELQTAVDIAEAASRAKSQFLGVVSHELRTPLNGIVGLVSMLSLTELTREQREIITLLELSGKALSNVVADVLDLSELASQIQLKLSPTNPVTVCEDVFNLFRSAAAHKDLQYTIQFSGTSIGLVLADEARLRQVFSKLIGNAIKFTHVGLIQVLVSSTLMAGRKASMELRVIDTGIGVPPETRSHLFELRSSQAVENGAERNDLTAGLAVAKQLVDLMGGQIGYIPRPDGGSEFWLRLEFAPTGPSLN